MDGGWMEGTKRQRDEHVSTPYEPSLSLSSTHHALHEVLKFRVSPSLIRSNKPHYIITTTIRIEIRTNDIERKVKGKERGTNMSQHHPPSHTHTHPRQKNFEVSPNLIIIHQQQPDNPTT
jgi:hypothetical protein